MFYERNSVGSCYNYLPEIKWSRNNYVYWKCGNTHCCIGRSLYSRRCTKCKYDESVTSETVFDKCSFPLFLVFSGLFKICTKKKGISSLELSEDYGLRQKACRKFKWKILQPMKVSGNYPLTREVHVDGFYVGGEEEGIIDSNSKGKKKPVVEALEIVKSGVGRAYVRIIDDASATSFRQFFEIHISKDATAVTDEWNGSKPLMRDYNIEQCRSDDRNAFPQMHIHIMNIKGWLRGIHHPCSKERMQGYLDEYHFKSNR